MTMASKARHVGLARLAGRVGTATGLYGLLDGRMDRSRVAHWGLRSLTSRR